MKKEYDDWNEYIEKLEFCKKHCRSKQKWFVKSIYDFAIENGYTSNKQDVCINEIYAETKDRYEHDERLQKGLFDG